MFKIFVTIALTIASIFYGLTSGLLDHGNKNCTITTYASGVQVTNCK